MTEPSLPKVVSQEEWQREVDQLRVKEKEITRATDAVNTRRRKLPMVNIFKDYEFEGEDGKVTLLDLFDGRTQLIIYHFMFSPDADAGYTCVCDGHRPPPFFDNSGPTGIDRTGKALWLHAEVYVGLVKPRTKTQMPTNLLISLVGSASRRPASLPNLLDSNISPSLVGGRGEMNDLPNRPQTTP